MDDDNSNDVVMVECTDNGNTSTLLTKLDPNGSRPIMQLFLRLISSDNKQNTVLTNAQIIEILQKEFNIDIHKLHDLEVDIYLNVVKRFLKDWPQWDDFDRSVHKLKKQNSSNNLDSTLELKYIDLKDYLKQIIDKTRPLASEAVNKMLQDNIETMKKVDTSDIVLEISCTRKQLNELIYDRPLPSNNSIFNFNSRDPTKISVCAIPIESILNWWGVKISIDLKFFNYTRSTIHQLKHTLVNKLNGPRDINETFDQAVQIKEQVNKVTNLPLMVNKTVIVEVLNNILVNTTTSTSVLRVVFDLIKQDLEPISQNLRVPGTYRQHSSKHPYYRKLKKELNLPGISALGNHYDLYIEEKITPMHVFSITKVYPVTYTPLFTTWLVIECEECNLRFTGIEMFADIKEHFNACHGNEPAWTCTNCEKSFTMLDLTERNWRHDCNK